MIIFGFEIPNSIREGITKYIGVALLYYFLGWELKKQVNTLNIILAEKHKTYFYILGIISVFLNYVEFYILNHYGMNIMPVNYIMTFPVVFITMILVIRFHIFDKIELLSSFGKDYSDKIYYWHPAVMSFISIMSSNYKLDSIMLQNPVAVFVFTLCSAMLIRTIITSIKINS